MVARYVEYMNIISKEQLIIFIWLGYLMNQTVFVNLHLKVWTILVFTQNVNTCNRCAKSEYPAICRWLLTHETQSSI